MRRAGLNTRMAIVAIIAIAPLAVAFWLLTMATTDLRMTNDELRAGQQRVLVANQIERRVVDIETGLRGYALTHDPSFITARDDAAYVLPMRERQLRVLVDDEHEPTGGAAQLGPAFRAVNDYVASYSDPLLDRLRRGVPGAGSPAAWIEGEHRVDRIRASLGRFVRGEQRKIQDSTGRTTHLDSRSVLVGSVGLAIVPLVALLAGFLVSRQLTRPIRRIQHAADRLRTGELDVRVPASGTPEVAGMAESFNAMASSMQRSRDALEQQNAELERSAETAATIASMNAGMLEASSDGYLAVDEDGVIRTLNPQAAQLFGYTEEAMLGHVLADMVVPPNGRAAHHDRRRALLAAGPRAAPYRVWVRRREGELFLVEISAAVVSTAAGRFCVYFLRDVTDRARREEERLAEEAVSRALVQTGPDEDIVLAIMAALGDAFHVQQESFWEYDGSSGTLFCTQLWNKESLDAPELTRMLREMRYDPDAAGAPVPAAWATGLTQWSLLEDLDSAAARVALGTTPFRSQLALPVSFSGEVLGVLAAGTEDLVPPDETRWTALRSIADLVGQVLGRRRAEQEADRLKNEFFALMSHELRTPLTSVIGYLDMVRSEEIGPLNGAQEKYLTVVDRNAHRLMRLVGDLLLVAQIESGTLALELSAVDLEQVVRDATEAAQPYADSAGVILSQETTPVTMSAGDADRLGQLMDNLLSNAIKFTPSGGSVRTRLSREGDQAVLAVRDTGPGITADDQEHLFERFFRTKEAHHGAVPGLGLGLSISLAIAEAQGGSLRIESELGHGATFRATLPVD